MSDSDILLPDLDTGVKNKIKQKPLADVPIELPLEEDRETDSQTDTSGTESESDSDSDSDSDSEYECKACDKKFSGYKPLKQHLKGKKHAKMISKKKEERKLLKEGAGEEVDDEYLIPEPFATCKTCDKQFSGPESYYMHLKCKKHKQKVLAASVIGQVREKGVINAEKLAEFYKNKKTRKDVVQNTEKNISSLVMKAEDGKSDDEFECKECDKVFSGLIPLTEHLMSKIHAKQVEKLNMLHKVIPEPLENMALDQTKEGKLRTLSVEDDIIVCKLCSMSFSGPGNAMMHMKSKNHSKNLDRYVRKLKKKELKEAKDLDLSSVKKEPKVKAENEPEDEAPTEEQQISNPLSKLDVSDHPTGEETANISKSSDNVKEELDAYDKYKKYKELMNSLQGEDEILN